MTFLFVKLKYARLSRPLSMVVFTCNACNESLKKNQVEKHYQHRCRRCEFLSCVDCGKEFWGDTYQNHTRCISEEEKYSGKNFVAKPNKGEVKQVQWIQKVQSAIQKAPANPQLKTLLQRLEEYPNVPRKRSKFENFLKCSLRVFNLGLVNQVWNLLLAEAQHQNGSNAQPAGGGEAKTDCSSGHSESGPAEQGSAAETQATEDKETGKKLNKRERKEDRRKKMHKGEKKDKHDEDNGLAEEEEGEKQKRKKGKRRKRDEEEQEETGAEVESQPKKKKKKGENGAAEEVNVTSENGAEIQDDSEVSEGKAGKFNWGATIIAVLESKGEISVKKLRKKVLAEYGSFGCSKPEEKLLAKFNKKLSRLPNVRVLKDRAKLIQS